MRGEGAVLVFKGVSIRVTSGRCSQVYSRSSRLALLAVFEQLPLGVAIFQLTIFQHASAHAYTLFFGLASLCGHFRRAPSRTNNWEFL